jgi:hypothetical protein
LLALFLVTAFFYYFRFFGYSLLIDSRQFDVSAIEQFPTTPPHQRPCCRF